MELTGQTTAEHNPTADASKAIEDLKKTLPAQQTQPSPPHKRRFEIELYDEVQVGENIDNIQLQKVIMEHPIIIEAANKKELDEHAARFKLCKQRMKIVRVLDDAGNQVPMKQAFDRPTEVQQHVAEKSAALPMPAASAALPPKQKPRYYSIGGIDIKDDNGKIYQKQWLRLSEKEAENFRLVNDSNNKIANINGKHLEMKRWVAVESSNADDDRIENELGEDL